MPWSHDGYVKVIWSRLYVNGHVILISSHLLLSNKLLTSFILKSYMPHFQLPTSFATVMSISSLPLSPSLYQLGYDLLLYRFGYNLLYISISSFWKRSPTCLTEPRPSSLLDGRLARKDYLQISAFPVRWWWSERRSTKESHWRSHE